MILVISQSRRSGYHTAVQSLSKKKRLRAWTRFTAAVCFLLRRARSHEVSRKVGLPARKSERQICRSAAERLVWSLVPHLRNTRFIAHAYIVKAFQLRMRTLAHSSEHNARS